MEMTNQSKHKQSLGQRTAEQALGCTSNKWPTMKIRNKTQANWPVDADCVAILLRQDLDVIPPKGEEQKSLNLRKKGRQEWTLIRN